MKKYIHVDYLSLYLGHTYTIEIRALIKPDRWHCKLHFQSHSPFMCIMQHGASLWLCAKYKLPLRLSCHAIIQLAKPWDKYSEQEGGWSSDVLVQKFSTLSKKLGEESDKKWKDEESPNFAFKRTLEFF